MRFRLATEADKHLPYYSHSIVEAIQTCPRWGLIRYKERKYFKANFRALALEAGSAMHEVFAALRLWQLYRQQNLADHFNFHGIRLFGRDRLESCFWPKPNARDEAMSFCFEILNSGDFFDDPSDNIRTVSNMEETTLMYVDRYMAMMDKNDVWVKDVNDPTASVGIELSFDMVVDDAIRYIGTIDGIAVRKPSGIIRLEENKTASRLDEAWRKSFDVKFQPTGYIIAGRLLTGYDIDQAKILGNKIKQTRSLEDFLSFTEDRGVEEFQRFYKSLWWTHRLALEYENTPLDAPQFTHSCNRYFRPCGFIDLCAASDDDALAMYESMEETPLTPTEQVIIGGGKKYGTYD